MATFKQYTKKDGSKLWLFKAYLGIDPLTGNQVTTTRRGFKTKKEAVLAESRLQLDYQENGLQKKAPSTTFQELYELWFETYKRTVRESTLNQTELNFKLHILPTFGKLNIEKIDVKLCQKMANKWQNERQTFGVLIRLASKIMKLALNMDLITINPFDRIIKPVKKETGEKKLKFYTSSQLQEMLEYLHARTLLANDLLNEYNALLEYSLVRLLAFSGMRVGEALALNYSDFNFEAGTITINKTVTATKKGYIISTSPKTKSSNRTIPLDPKTIRIMKQWQLKQKELLFSNRLKGIDLVFTNFNGKLLTPTLYFYRINKRASEIELPLIGLHGYRHTHASMLFEAGATMKEVQVRLGHSNIEMTMNVYTHVTEKIKVETVEKLAKFASF